MASEKEVIISAGVLFFLYYFFVRSKPENSKAERATAWTDTPEMRIISSGTQTPVPVQAGFPGNTIAAAPYTATPSASSINSDSLDWQAIPVASSQVFVGAELNGGPFDAERRLAYFVVLQVPSTQPKEIYGPLCIFVEGGKVGFKVGDAVRIFEYKFNFNRRGTYRIEMKFNLESATLTRVELCIDGAATGQEMVVDGTNMLAFLRGLPNVVFKYDKVASIYLQAKRAPPSGWGNIVEIPMAY